MSYVIDASVAIKWVVPEVLSEKAEEILSSDEELLAPDFLLIEAANTLWKKAVRREISAREAERALSTLTEGAVVWRPTAPLLSRAMEIARRVNHPVYDCIYLALAERERAILVTADRRLLGRAALRKLNVRVVDLASL